MIREMGFPASRETFAARLQGVLRQSLQSLAQAVADGAIFVENERLRVPRLPAEPEPVEVKALRDEIFAAIS